MSALGGSRAAQPPSQLSVESIARRCRAMSEPARLALLHALRAGSATADELHRITGSGDVSQHLNVLLDSGFVRRTATGAQSRYEVAEDVIARCWNEHAPARLRARRHSHAVVAQYIHDSWSGEARRH